MTIALGDTLELLAAMAGHVVVLLLPALALARLTGVLGTRDLRGVALLPRAMLLGYAVLPILDSLLARGFGLRVALAVNLALAILGAAALWQQRGPWPGRAALAGGAAVIALVVLAFVDVDAGGRLFPSLLMIDNVKHAATVRALVETGAVPPYDPFFLRDDPAGYYYFYYVAPALTHILGGGWISPRAAMGGQIPFTVLALAGLVAMLLREARLPQKPQRRVVIALMLAAGLQLWPILAGGLRADYWYAQINWWAEEVGAWPLLVLWVPHHVAGLVAGWAGLLLLAPLTGERRTPRETGLSVLLAGAAFASMLGLSVWVMLGAVAIVAVWLASLLRRRHWRAAALVIAAGFVSLVLAAPDLHDLLAGRAYAGPAVRLSVREFPLAEVLSRPGWERQLARLIALPFNYLLELGVLLIGASLYWSRRYAGLRGSGEVHHLLTLSAIVTLLIASFLRSTIVNNDLGWRVIMFAQLSALIWTATVLSAELGAARWHAAWRVLPRAAVVTLLFGWAGVAYDLVMLRGYRIFNADGIDGLTREPAIDHDLRLAYTWLGRNVDAGRIVQHNPAAERSFAYGLYGRARVAVSDYHNATLFGASRAAAWTRLRALIPVFTTAGQVESAQAVFAAHRVDIAVVTAADGAWHDPGSFVWRGKLLQAWPLVRVLDVSGAPP